MKNTRIVWSLLRSLYFNVHSNVGSKSCFIIIIKTFSLTTLLNIDRGGNKLLVGFISSFAWMACITGFWLVCALLISFNCARYPGILGGRTPNTPVTSEFLSEGIDTYRPIISVPARQYWWDGSVRRLLMTRPGRVGRCERNWVRDG